MEKVEVIIEKGTQNYGAFLPQLLGCVTTGDSISEIKENIKEAIQMHLDGMIEDGDEIPKEFKDEYELVFIFDLETFLSFYEKYFTRRALSRLSGINESLLSQYAIGLKKPRKKQSKKLEESIHTLAKELLQIQF